MKPLGLLFLWELQFIVQGPTLRMCNGGFTGDLDWDARNTEKPTESKKPAEGQLIFTLKEVVRSSMWSISALGMESHLLRNNKLELRFIYQNLSESFMNVVETPTQG